MPTVKEIYELLNEKAPFSLQEDWDNSGFLIGDPNVQVQRVLTALDITDEVIDEAVSNDADLIVSHHPVIFHPAKRMTLEPDDLTGRKLWTMARHNISAICCHTNLDAVEGGVNTVLAQKLGLTQLELLEQAGTDPKGQPCGIGRIGFLPEAMEPEAFLELVQSALHPNGMRYVAGNSLIRRVAVGGGACGDMLWQAYRAGCHAFVTSDLKYNMFLDARDLGLTLVDAGHFPTENPAVSVLVRWLREGFPHLEVEISRRHEEVICYKMPKK